ncbi:MAG: type II secretion system F family protein [Acidilobaceae archaeon]
MIPSRLMNIVDYVALTYLGGIGAYVAKTFELEDSIRKAGMNVYPPLYAAKLVLLTAAIFIASFYVSAFLWLIQMPLAAKLLLSLIVFLFPVVVFAIGLYYPSYREGERRSWVDTELPLFAAYLTAMAMAGLDMISTLERLAKLRTFREMKAEADRFLSDVKIMGRDPLDAIERSVSHHPSRHLRDFLQGYAAVTRTGGSVVGYLETKTAEMFRQKMDELKLIADRVSLYMELYIILGVIVSISLYLLFTVNALMPGSGGGGFSSAQLLVYSFVFMPLTSMTLIYLIGKVRPRNPVEDLAPLAFFVTYGVPLFFASLVLLGAATGSHKVLAGEVTKETILGAIATLTLSLILLSFPSVIAWRLRQATIKGMGNSIANFLRDLVEVRKMGLSPEKSIVLLSQRDYGALNPVLRKIATSLTLGFDIERAIAFALRGYRNWMLIATMRFLSDVIVFGGGSIETLDSLARFSRSLADFEEEVAKKFKVYLLMPYVGVALVVGSSLLMVSYMVQTLSLDPVKAELFMDEIRYTTLYMSIGAIFNAWLMGLVAGKLTSGSALAGLIHSIILTLLAGLTAFYIVSNISF